MNIPDEIKRLHELHQAGALTDAEFEQAKAKLLAQSSVSLNKPGELPPPGPAPRPAGSGGPDLSGVTNLRRSRSDRWLGGVCGGLAKVSGLESWIWRLIFAVSGLFTFIVPILCIYALMWIFVPEE